MVCTNVTHSLNLIVPGGCSSTGAVTPRLVEVVDEIWEEKEEMRDSTQRAKHEVVDQTTQLDKNYLAKVRGGCFQDRDTADEDVENLEDDGNIWEDLGSVEDENIGNTVKEDNCLEGRVGSRALGKVKPTHWFSGVHCVAEGCEKVLYSSIAMKDHMRSTHGAEKLSCPRSSCEAKFGSSWGLKLHLRRHDKTAEKFPCSRPSCGEMFVSSWYQKQHMRKTHGAEKMHCPRPGCQATYVSSWALKLHLRQHDKDLKVTRKVENQIEGIETQESVVNQVREAGALKLKPSQAKLKSNEAKKIAVTKCEVEGCLEIFSPGVGHRRADHMRTEHVQNELQCDECDASFFSRDYLDHHVKKVHFGGGSAAKCEVGNTRNRDIGRENLSDTVEKVEENSSIIVEVKEPEFEVLDMEIF